MRRKRRKKTAAKYQRQRQYFGVSGNSAYRRGSEKYRRRSLSRRRKL